MYPCKKRINRVTKKLQQYLLLFLEKRINFARYSAADAYIHICVCSSFKELLKHMLTSQVLRWLVVGQYVVTSLT